jgi:DNA-binding NarL/FixJ family response regulator
MPVLKTFLVEDSPVIRDNLIATLEELVPVQVVGTAEDEATALAWLEGTQSLASKPGSAVDLVIVDIFLKGGSGLGVLRKADMRQRCLELGADRVFDKSGEIDALIQYCAHLAAGDTGGPGDAAANGLAG